MAGKKSIIILLAILSWIPAVSQKYGTAPGIRIARKDLGLTLEQRIADRATMEFLLCSDLEDHSATLLLAHHFPILFNSFNYYLGLGGHFGYLQKHGYYRGVDVVLGIEYKFPLIPLLISYDLKPEFHFDHKNWFEMNTAFSARYILISQKERKKQIKKKRKKK